MTIDLVTPLVAFAPPLGLLAGAAVLDARTRRVPNVLTLSLATMGVVHAGIVGGAAAAAGSLAVGVIGVAALIMPFRAGLLGGGDVKLVGAAGTWLGLSGLLRLLVLSAVAGGVLSLAFYFASSSSVRREVRERMLDLTAARPGKPTAPRVPYAIAISLVAAVLIVVGEGGR